MLHFFRIALFYFSLFLSLSMFFLCCTFFKIHFFRVILFLCCTLLMLHFFHVALFSCCTLFMLHFFHISSKEFLDIQATIECRFTLKRVRDLIITYSQMHDTDKYSQDSSVIGSVNGCGFESRYCHLNFRYRACCE